MVFYPSESGERVLDSLLEGVFLAKQLKYKG